MTPVMNRLRQGLAVLLWLAWCSHAQGADLVQLTLQGLEGELRRNTLAWLGARPDTPQQRLLYVGSIEQKVEHSLQSMGYYHPRIVVDVQRMEPAWRVTIGVDKGQPVRLRNISIQLMGEADEDPAFHELVAAAPFGKGDILNHGVFETFRKQLLSVGLRRGYFDAGLTLGKIQVEPAADRADIFLHYDSGPRYRFGPVLYDENRIDRRLLNPLMTFAEGDFYDRSVLQRFQSQLQQTRYFSAVHVRPLTNQTSDLLVPIELLLSPAVSHAIDLGIGYSTDTGERVTATWRTPRINRHGHSQETRIQYSDVNPSGRIIYSIPYRHPLEDVLQLSMRLEDNEYGSLDSEQREMGIRRETAMEDWVRGFSLRQLNESWDLAGDSRSNGYLLAGASLSRRARSGSAINPSAGFSQLYQLELAGRDAGSDVNLLRLTTDFRYIRSLSEDHRVVARSSLGAAFISNRDRQDLAPSLSFFAGGKQSIRGFAYHSIGNRVEEIGEDGSTRSLVIGGTRLATASLEYQYSVNREWRASVFTDAGDAFDEGEFDLNYSLGLGAHYMTPIGAVRFEIARGLSRDDPSWRFHLDIGAEF